MNIDTIAQKLKDQLAAAQVRAGEIAAMTKAIEDDIALINGALKTLGDVPADHKALIDSILTGEGQQ
jgi:hypothetical protein